MKIALCGLRGDSSCVLCWGSLCGRASPRRENKKMAMWGFWALKLCFIRAQNQNTPDLLGEMDWLQTNLPLLGRLFSSSSLALGPVVFGFHQSHSHLPLRSWEKSDFLMPLWLEWVFGVGTLPACPCFSWPRVLGCCHLPFPPGQQSGELALVPLLLPATGS